MTPLLIVPPFQHFIAEAALTSVMPVSSSASVPPGRFV